MSPRREYPARGFLFLAIAFLMLAPLAAAQSRFTPRPTSRPAIRIDPGTPLKDLLPEPPEATTASPSWRVKDLSKVPEIFFQKVRRLSPSKELSTLPGRERRDALDKISEEKEEDVARLIAKIHHLDATERDHFLHVLRQSRSDLAGLPFLLGDDCRQSSASFEWEVFRVRTAFDRPVQDSDTFWRSMGTVESLYGKHAGQMAALMQILATEHKSFGPGLVVRLSEFRLPEATRCLTKLAMFSFDVDVRYAAARALRSRPASEYREMLLAGLEYPWPEIARFAAEAIVEVNCKELIPEMEKLLDAPDPRAPQTKVLLGREMGVVREVVRLNHNHNCLLCHAAAKASDVTETRLLTGPVPITSQPLPAPEMYYSSGPPDVRVRADVTYLRQDFSLRQAVSDPGPWPGEQRFDFLVRTRIVGEAEIADYRAWRAEQGPDYTSPYHKAVQDALYALRTPPEERIRRLLLNLQK